MNDFLTVEDVNSILLNYSKVNSFYEVNTSLIVENSEFFDITYDFVKVTHIIENDEHTFSFEIHNDLWCGGYYFTDQYGNYIREDATYEDDVLTLTTEFSDVILVLYLNNLFTEFSFERLLYKPTVTSANMFFHQLNSLNQQVSKYHMEYLDFEVEPFIYGGLVSGFYNGRWINVAVSPIRDNEPGNEFYFGIPLMLSNPSREYTVFKIEMDDNTFYFTRNYIKHIYPVKLRIDDNKFVLGKINYFYIEYQNILGDFVTDIHIHYKNQIIPVILGTRIKLDLRNEFDTGNIVFKVVVGESPKIKGYEYHFEIPCGYTTVTTKNQLQEELNTGGSSIIEIGDDFSLQANEDIHIEHDIIIKGNFKTLNMLGNSFIIDDGVTVIFQDLKFRNGNPIFIQEKNSNLTLNNCYFINANASDFNGLGSVIHCNIDKNSLNEDNDFKTDVINCIFDNISSSTSIFHSGELKVDKCKVKTTSLSTGNYNPKIPWFLYQTDGNAILTNNIFDFNVNTNNFCSNRLNIGFYQALLHCGLNASINNASWGSLNQNNALPFFDSRYNNKSHIFMKYYSSQVRSCLFTSPDHGYEDKSCCHTISNVDYVFKNNAQLTNANWHSENTLNKINLDLSWGGG